MYPWLTGPRGERKGVTAVTCPALGSGPELQHPARGGGLGSHQMGGGVRAGHCPRQPRFRSHFAQPKTASPEAHRKRTASMSVRSCTDGRDRQKISRPPSDRRNPRLPDHFSVLGLPSTLYRHWPRWYSRRGHAQPNEGQSARFISGDPKGWRDAGGPDPVQCTGPHSQQHGCITVPQIQKASRPSCDPQWLCKGHTPWECLCC